MAKRPTIEDVAKASGVSVATVDRVLNGRARVREETARRVYDAAIDIGYHAAGLIEQRILADVPEYRLGIVLQKERQQFYRNLVVELHQAAKRVNRARIALDILFAPSQSASDFAALFARAGRHNQAVAGISIDHHSVTAEVSELREKNILTYSLLSDFAQGVRESYIGLNNLKLGRGTAWMISKIARPGRVAIFVGGHRWHGHELRETGFRSYFRESASDFTMLDTLVNLETRQLTYEATLDLLERYPDIVGLYSAGGGMEGAIEAIREVREPGEIVLVVNEDTPITRSALQDGYLCMANVTPLDRICDMAFAQMIQGIENGSADAPRQHFVAQDFLFPEML